MTHLSTRSIHEEYALMPRRFLFKSEQFSLLFATNELQGRANRAEDKAGNAGEIGGRGHRAAGSSENLRRRGRASVVPLFVKTGDVVRVDLQAMKYMDRVKTDR
jgi:hypothetical protein